MRVGVFGAAIIAACVVGCSELEVQRLPAHPTSDPLVGSMTYYLPRTVITVTGTVTLNYCGPKLGPDGQPVVDKHNQEIQDLGVAIQLAPATSTEPDPDHHYSISYEKARSWTKEVNYSVNNNTNGTLQEFNGTLNDQAGPIIVAAIGAATQIGTSAALLGLPKPALVEAEQKLATPPAKPVTDICQDFRQGLDIVNKLQTDINTIRQKVPASPADATNQNAQITWELGEIDAANKRFGLVRSVSFRWVPRRTDDFSHTNGNWVSRRDVELASVIARWLTLDGRDWLFGGKSGDIGRKLRAPYRLILSMSDTMTADPRAVRETDQPSREDPTGLVVRDPVTALLRFCHLSDRDCDDGRHATFVENSTVETTEDAASRATVKLAQFGPVLIFTERSGLFENAVLDAALASDGTITKVSYHVTNSVAQGLKDVGTAAGNVGSGVSSRNSAIAADNTAAAAVQTARTNQIQAPDTYNKALADCLSNRAAIIKAGGTPVACQ